MFLKNFSAKELLTIIFLISAIIIINIESRKRKPKPKKPKKPYNPRDKKPTRINDDLYCNICRDIVKETARTLYGKKKDYEVIEALEKVCDLEELYPISKKSFPFLFFLKIKKIKNKKRLGNEYLTRKDACDVFVAAWNEDMEKVFVNRVDDESPINQICFDITKACDFDYVAPAVKEENEYALDEDKAKKDEI